MKKDLFFKLIRFYFAAEVAEKVEKVAEQMVPEYFYEIPSSSSGKYHPEDELCDGGLVLHTAKDLEMANTLMSYSLFNYQGGQNMSYNCLWKSHFEKLLERAKKTLVTKYRGREYTLEVDWEAATKDSLLRVDEGTSAKIPLRVEFTTFDANDFEEEEGGRHGICCVGEEDVCNDIVEALQEASYYEMQDFDIDCDTPEDVEESICVTDEGYISPTLYDPGEGWFETEGSISFKANLVFTPCSKLWATYKLAKYWIEQYKEVLKIIPLEVFYHRYTMDKVKAAINKMEDIQLHLICDECRDLWYKTPDGVEHQFKDAYTKHPERGLLCSVNYDVINTIINIVKLDGTIIYKTYKEE